MQVYLTSVSHIVAFRAISTNHPTTTFHTFPLLIIIDMLSIRYYWGRYHRHSIKIMLPFALVGIGVGALLFSTFSDNERALKVGIGLLSVGFVMWRMVQKVVLFLNMTIQVCYSGHYQVQELA